jgi:DNA topoisomerase-1
VRDGAGVRAATAEVAAEVEVAALAGLRYVTDADPGIRRRRRGRGVEYRHADGRRATPADVERARALAIPPAWTDVWICADPRGHLQATGRDARGRKQYRYHPEWTAVRDGAKFERLAAFGERLPRLRGQVASDLALPGLSRRKVTAAVVALLDRTLIRVGNDEYRRMNGTYGLTTLTEEHVDVDGTEISFSFVGKGGREHEVSVRDQRLARIVRRCHELGGKELFTYRDPDGRPARVDSADCNEYLGEVLGVEATAKDFRTWGASTTALRHLAAFDPGAGEAAVLAAVDAAAERLGNTRAVCRRSYVHPSVIEAFPDGDVHRAWRSSRRGTRTSRAERALLRLLAS